MFGSADRKRILFISSHRVFAATIGFKHRGTFYYRWRVHQSSVNYLQLSGIAPSEGIFFFFLIKSLSDLD